MRALWVVLTLLLAASAGAQELRPGGPGRESIDGTRLDVARLPPEALSPDRALYHRGLFLEAQLGGLTFAGDVRAVSRAGPRFAVSLGYDLARWFACVVQVEGSLHQTKNEPPPAQAAYSLVLGTLGARFVIPLDARHALSITPSVGVVWASDDVLRGLGFRDAYEPGIAYGGELGYDFHLPSRHHSLGVLSGARHLPSLSRDGATVGIHASAYLRYVF